MRFIPTVRAPFPDELFYSYMGRLAVMNGVDIENFSGMFLGIRDVNKDTLPPDGRTAFVQLYKHLPFPGDMAETYLGLTTFAFEAMALTPGQQTKYINSVMRPESALNPPAPSMFPKIMVCPECAKEDIEKYGTMYYHRVHHLPGVKVCPKHHVPLLTNRYMNNNALEFNLSRFKKEVWTREGDEAYADYASAVHEAGVETDALAVQGAFMHRYAELGYDVQAGLIPPVRSMNEWHHGVTVRMSGAEIPQKTVLKEEHVMDAAGIISHAMDLFPDPQDFIAALAGHEPLLETHTCHVCGEVYCATPQSVRDGWGCPECTRDAPSGDMFARIVSTREHGAYELIDRFAGLDKPLAMRHSCGKVITVTPEHFLFRGARCACKDKASLTDRLSSYPPPLPFSFDGSRAAVTVSREVKDSTVECIFLRFQPLPEFHREEPFRYTQETFEKAVYDLVGDEYAVVSEYRGRVHPIEIRHNACDVVSEYRIAKSFLEGRRCPVCGGRRSFICVEGILDSVSGGRCILLKLIRGYEVIDTHTGTGVKLKTEEVLRELNRPGGSEVIPAEEDAGGGRAPYWDAMYALLLDYQQVNGTGRPPRGLWYKGRPLGSWVLYQLETIKDGTIGEEKADLLSTAGIVVGPTPKSAGLSSAENWQRRFGQYQRYVEKYGTGHVPKDTSFEGEWLDQWIIAQRRRYFEGSLSEEQAEKLLSVYPKIFSLSPVSSRNGLSFDENWERRFKQYEEYVEKHGVKRLSSSTVYEDEGLGGWTYRQRKMYHDGNLADDRARRLLAVDPHFFDPGPLYKSSSLSPDENWMRRFGQYKRFVEESGSVKIPAGTVVDGENLTFWICNQRRKYRNGDLTREQAEAMTSVDPDFFDTGPASARCGLSAKEEWEQRYKQYRRYVKKNKSTFVSSKAVFEGQALGCWVADQRAKYRNGKLSDDQIEKLLSVNPDFFSSDGRWLIHLHQLENFVKMRGVSALEPSSVYNGYEIGHWANRQRLAYKKGKLSNEKTQALLDIDPCFFRPNPRDWEVHYKQFRKYISETGAEYIKRNAVYEGWEMGSWVSIQVQSFKDGTLPCDRELKLRSAMPGIFEPYPGDWQVRFEQYRRYVEETGSTYVPCDAVFEGWKVGNWVSNQHYRHKSGKMSDEHIKKLLEIDPDFFKPRKNDQ